MKSLRDYLSAKRIDETEAMNLLQEYGIISDECITPEDVGDAGKAVTWIHDRRHLFSTI